MAEEVGSVEVVVKGNTTQLEKDLGRAENTTKSFDKAVNDAAKSTGDKLSSAAKDAAENTKSLSSNMSAARGVARGLGEAVGDAVRASTGLNVAGTAVSKGVQTAVVPAVEAIGTATTAAAVGIGGLTIALGGLATVVGGTVLYALHSVVSENKELEKSLQGVGRMSGTSVQDIRDFGANIASLGTISRASARQIVASLASVGTITRENLEPAGKTTLDLAKVLRVDVTEATKVMARGLGGGAKEMQELLKSVGGLNDGLRRQIDYLVDSGQQAAAQAVVIRTLDTNIQNAAKDVGLWASATQFFSDSWDTVKSAVVSGLAPITGGAGQTAEQRIADLTKLQGQLQDQIKNDQVPYWAKAEVLAQLKSVNAELEKNLSLEASRKQQAEEVSENQRSLQVGAGIDMFNPQSAQLQKARATLSVLQDEMIKVRVRGQEAFDPAYVEQLTTAINKGAVAVDNLEKGFAGLLGQQIELQRKGIQANFQGPEARAQFARESVLFQANRRGEDANDPKVQAAANLAADNARLQVNLQLDRVFKSQLLSQEQRTEMIQAEIGTVGKVASEQDRVRATLQAKFQLQQEALRIYGDENAYDQKKLEALTQQINKQAQFNQLLAAARLNDDLIFQLQQLGRDDIGARVAQQLRSAGVDANTEFGKLLANLSETTAKLQEAKSAATDFVGGFVKGMLHGQSASEALGNSLSRLADRLADLATNQLISGIFRGLTGGLAGGIPGLNPASLSLGMGVYHQGGMVGSSGVPRRVTRLHTGADLASDEVFAVLQKGEKVIPRNENTQSQGQPIVIQNTFNNVDPSMRAFIAQNNAVLTKQIRSATPGDVGKFKSNNPGYLSGVGF